MYSALSNHIFLSLSNVMFSSLCLGVHPFTPPSILPVPPFIMHAIVGFLSTVCMYFCTISYASDLVWDFICTLSLFLSLCVCVCMCVCVCVCVCLCACVFVYIHVALPVYARGFV